LRRLRRLRNFAEVAPKAVDAPPPSAEGCWLRLLRCRTCGVRMEPVPWARPGAQHTREFEDVVAWLAQQMAKTPITGLLRVGWDTVGRIVARVTADRLDERRLEAWSASASTRSPIAAITVT
jgi:hypothetical protein